MSFESDHPDTSAGNRTHPCLRCNGTGTREYIDFGRIGPRWEHPPTLEHPCPRCGAWYTVTDAALRCWFCHHEQPFDRREWCLDRLTSDTYPERAHKPGVLMGTCPVCDTATSVNGGPDGELVCGECSEFYAGQYSTEWWLYPLWNSRLDTAVVVR